MSLVRQFIGNEGGATAIEYGLICGLIFVAIVAAITQFADSTNLMYAKISGNMK